MKKLEKDVKDVSIEILEIETGTVTFHVLGVTPYIFHSFSETSRRELLIPEQKVKGGKKLSLKHNPVQEFRDSCYMFSPKSDGPTRLFLTAGMFKAAIASVALDMPGASKAEIGRLVWIVERDIPVYGEPKLLMSMVRMSDMRRTPDVRTRAILPEWAAKVTVRFTKPHLTEKAVANLVAAAGVMRGVGDWRVEKGKGDHGQFELVAANDPRWLAIVKKQGKAAQDAALAEPQPYDEVTARDLAYFNAEVGRRGLKAVI